MATYGISEQLSLPRSPQQRREPTIADAGDVQRRRPDAHKLPTELSDAELLTTVLGPSTALSCAWLTTTYDNFREIAFATAGELVEHGFTTGAVHRLSAVFEIAKRYGEKEWKIGEPFRGSADIYAHFREHLAAETREHFYVVMLDNKHRKLCDVLLSLGSLTSSIVHPRLCAAAHKRGYVTAIVMWRSG